MSLPPDIVEGKFEVLHKISEGGMGAVFKVRHILLDQPFVIKVIRSQLEGDENLKLRFHQEAQAASRLRKHPNIAGVHDFSIGSDGTAYIVMEFIEGSTLKEILAQGGPPPLPLTLEIACQSLQALGFLHQQGYIHRDVAPDNLMLSSSFDGKPLVKLIDLGLTKRLGTTGELTTEGAFLGKVRYSAPEQFKNEALDPRSDLYSFGVMFYELLTGRRPIEGEEFTALLAGHLFRQPLDFDVADPDGRISPELRRIVMRTLDKEPDRRFASAEELGGALEPFRRPASIAGADVERTIDLARSPAPAASSLPRPEVSASAPTVPEPSVLEGAAAATLVTAEGRRREEPREESRAAPAETGAESSERRPAPPAKIRPAWVAAAAAAVVAAAVLWWVAGGGGEAPIVEIPPAQASYRLALEAIERQDWPAAGDHLEEALELDSREVASPEWADPAWDGPYLPHYYRGLVHFKRLTCALAEREWKKSENLGVVQQTPLHRQLLENRAACWQEVEGDLERVESLFEEASGVAADLADALDDPALKLPAATATAIRRALEDCDEIAAKLESVKLRQDFAEAGRIEEEVFRVKDEVDRLEREVLGST